MVKILFERTAFLHGEWAAFSPFFHERFDMIKKEERQNGRNGDENFAGRG
ncbi:hypothetical protein [Geobacillus stearothermophilus]